MPPAAKYRVPILSYIAWLCIKLYDCESVSSPPVLYATKVRTILLYSPNVFPAGGLGGGLVLKDLLSQVKFFGIYSKSNGKPLKVWKQGTM